MVRVWGGGGAARRRKKATIYTYIKFVKNLFDVLVDWAYKNQVTLLLSFLFCFVLCMS